MGNIHIDVVSLPLISYLKINKKHKKQNTKKDNIIYSRYILGPRENIHTIPHRCGVSGEY